MNMCTFVATANDSRELHDPRTSTSNQKKKIKYLFKPTNRMEAANTGTSQK